MAALPTSLSTHIRNYPATGADPENLEQRRFLSAFLRDVLCGLGTPVKTVPCKYLYDARGCELFDQICDLPEYYPTRTEIGILRNNLPAISRQVGPGVEVIEYGSGSGLKTQMLLRALASPAGCTLVEIARPYLARSVQRMKQGFPDLPVTPVCADYTRRVRLPAGQGTGTRKLVFFPGSTIGNFHHDEVRGFLQSIAETVGSGGGLLIGVDLVKDTDVLEAAYDDSAGVTAMLNLNLLRRINADLGADFDLECFSHRAVFNPLYNRVEMHLVSLRDQNVIVAGRTFAFEAGETIHTENSYKYTLQGFKKMAASAGWQLQQVWTDDQQLFSIQYLTVA